MTRNIFVAALYCLLIIALIALSSCSEEPERLLSVVDTENNNLVVLTGEKAELNNFYNADFVVLGGGLGGIAAALSICNSGRTVILVEETDRIAGCFAFSDTSHFNLNRFAETSGTSEQYHKFRNKIREWYDTKNKLAPQFFSELYGNIDDFQPDSFCFETDAAIDVIYDILEKNIRRERLTILKRHKVAEIVTFNNRISSMNAIDLDNLVLNQITGWIIIDATRSGYIFPLAGIDYVIGRESKSDTGESSAPDLADSLSVMEILYGALPDPSQKNNAFVSALTPVKPESARSKQVSVLHSSRRIKSKYRITEMDISATFNDGPRARFFKDSVGIGYRPIIIAAHSGESPLTIEKTVPFQIPLSAMVPTTFTNVLAGGPTIGTTYGAASAFAAPSTEWAIGEAAGVIAAFCAGRTILTHELLNSDEHMKNLQNQLVTRRGIPIYWYDDVTYSDPDFAEAQLKPFEEPSYHDSATNLHYKE